MKKYNNVVIAVFLVFGVFDVMAQVDFNYCPGDVTKCNAFYPQFACYTTSVKTMYGAPKLLNYTYERYGYEHTNQVVKLTGTKKTINGLRMDVDAGIEFEYIFAPNRSYIITISASGLKNETGSNVIARLEVILGSQSSTQYISGCDPDVFDFQKNNGTVVINAPINSYYPQNYTAYFRTGTANVSKVKIRCINTNDATWPESLAGPDINNSYALIYNVAIEPNNENSCDNTDVYITRNIFVDYAHQPTDTYPTIEGSFNSTTVTSHIDVKNGTYRILSNHNIYLKPGFHATLGVNGNIQAVIGRCDSGAPLRVATNPNTENKPNESHLINGSFVFPNPANDELNLILKEPMSISQEFVFDNLGRKVAIKVKKVDRNKLTLDVTSLKNGVYYLSIANKTSLKTYKFMVYR
jgi:hypothetical protein